MVANPNTLYLQECPKPYSGKIVHLTPLKETQGSISPEDLATLLAAMTQELLIDMSKTVQALAQQEEANAQASQLNVGAAQSQAEQAVSDQQKLQAEEHQTIWQQIANAFIKYVLPALMCIVAAVIFGPAAGIIAGAIFLATAVPIKDGKSLVALASSGIADSLSKDCGWSAGTTQLVQGVLNVVIAVGLAVVSGGAASTCTAGEAVAEVATTVEETVTTTIEESAASTLENGSQTVSKLQTSAGRFTAVNAFSSTTSNTSSWNDIAFGIWQLVDKNPSDQDKGKEIAQIINTVMNVITAFASIGVTSNAFSQGLKASGTISTMIQKGFTAAGYVTNLAVGGSVIAEGVQNQSLEDLTAEVTQKMGQLHYIEGVDHIASQNSTNLNTALKNALAHYDTMLGNNPNYASVELTEAKMLSVCNNKA